MNTTRSTPDFHSATFLRAHIAQTMAFYHPRAIDPDGGFFHYFRDDGSVYAGLAAEREFSGSQHATAAGLDMPAPSLSGTTGIVELGWRVPQTAGNPFGVDISLAGLFGKRQGITGGVSFIWGW